MAREARRFAWSPGTAYRYAFELSDRETATPSAATPSIAVETHLAGELVIRCHEATARAFVLGLSFARLDRAELTAGGRVVSLDDVLRDREVLIEIDGRGAVSRLLYPARSPAELAPLMQSVVSVLGVHLPQLAEAIWEVDEPTPLGLAHAHYAEHDDGTIRRSHARYAELRGVPSGVSLARASVTSNDVVSVREGILERLDSEERVVIPATTPATSAPLDASVHASVRHVATERFSLVPIAHDAFEPHDPTDVPMRARMERQLLQGLAGALTFTQLEAVVAAHVHGRALAPGFVTRAVALLKLEPAYASALEEVFARPSTSFAARALIADLLASAGTTEAQAALRSSISSPVARRDVGEHGVLLQRLGLVTAPDAASVAYLFREYTTAGSRDLRAASAFALGSSMGTFFREGHSDLLAVYNARLTEDLRRAKDAKERVALLAGLGNAALPQNVRLVRGFAHDSDPSVRRQVALSLRRTPTPEARASLLDLATDADPPVGLAALDALAHGDVVAADLHALARGVVDDSLAADRYESLMTLAAEHPELHDSQMALLQAVLARAQTPRTLARARMLLERLQE